MYKITEINGIKTYNMSAGKTNQQFLADAKKTNKSLRYDQQFRRRIQLIQDFQFEVSTNQVQISPDQRYIVAAGIYAPQIKIFDTAELSMKCLRGIDSEVIKFKILSNDYSKIVMAQNDRTIEFHAQYGAHYKTRIPHYPRDLEYNTVNANICVSASANQIYRISLEEGKFMTPFHTDSFINSMHFNQPLNILACGGDELEIWDFRERNRVCKLKTSGTVTHVKCDSTGLLIGVGEGSVLSLYDVRFDRKILSIKSSYNEAINSIHFMNNSEKNILFSNKKQIKITNGEGKFLTSIEPDHNINMFTTIDNDSGLILAALEDSKIGCFFLPQLGPAPKWVPYIENITEELEEEQIKTVYDQYKFVSKNQVYELGCSNLVHTKMLKEYMHGYLMHLRLYNKMKTKLDTINIQQVRNRKIENILTKEIPKKIQTLDIVEDPRFQMDSNNPEFQVNKFSEDYMVRHPHMKKKLEKEKVQHQRQLEKELRIKKKKIIQKKEKRDKPY